MTETNIHSPANFKPEDYSVVDYLDNKRPQYRGGSIEGFKAEVEAWERDIVQYFPHWRTHAGHDIKHCHHCGNGLVRYICVVEHLPSKALLVFGSECVHKLAFANRDELKLAQLKARAERGHARLAVWILRTAFLEAFPALAALIEARTIEAPVHAGNSFAHDILRKLDQYGSLSPFQVSALFKSLAVDVERATRQSDRDSATVPAS